MSSNKRKVLTPEERIAKAQAEIAAIEAKEQAKKDKRVAELLTKHDKLVARVRKIEDVIIEQQDKAAAIQVEMSAVEDELTALGVNSPDQELPIETTEE